jgi:pimeloyl-ACP methyl ester carboxylesterase
VAARCRSTTHAAAKTSWRTTGPRDTAERDALRGRTPRKGWQGGIKGEYDCIKQLSEKDFTEDLKKFDVPTLIAHGDDDQVVPIEVSALRSAKLVKDATLKIYKGGPHGLATTRPMSSTPIFSSSSGPA